MKQSEFIIPPGKLQDESLPLIFLAGPVQGAPDHQAEVAHAIMSTNTEVNVVSPRGDYSAEDAFYGDPQIEWEKHHFLLARDKGIISFNFEARDESLPLEDGHPYAKTSNLEIMKVFGWLDYNPNINLAVRIDPEYAATYNSHLKNELQHRNITIFTGDNQQYAEYLVDLARQRLLNP